ncbi:MAG: DUF4402 domain-containing protein [Allopontixanthobacter sediminis]
MKSKLARLCAAGALLPTLACGLGTPAWADDTAEAESRVLVLRPLSLIKDDDLDFGLIVPGPTPGFVILAPEGGVTRTGGVRALAGDNQPATFYGYGTYRQNLRLRVTANSYQLRRQNGTETMRLDTMTISSNPQTQLTTTPRLFYIGALDGFFSFALGGRLRVGANQRVGVYTGNVTVTIDYL